METSDIRDLRDPQEYALMLRRMVMTRTDCNNMREAQDIAERLGFRSPDYSGEPVDHATRRQEELQVRAASGDKFAAALLNGNYAGEEPTD